MKKRLITLCLCGILSATALLGCAKNAPQEASAEVVQETPTETPTEAVVETVSEDTTVAESTELTKDEIREMLGAMGERMEENPSFFSETYAVEGTDVTKTMVMGFSQDSASGLGYVNIAAPAMQMEIYVEKDGHLYVDMSTEVPDEVPEDEAEDSENIYFDGTKYHSLEKAEPKEGGDAQEITESFAGSSYDTSFFNSDDMEIISQKTDGENTLVSIAVKDNTGYSIEEKHVLLYIENGQITRFVVSAEAEPGNSAQTEAYTVATIGSQSPVSIPEYFDTIEYSDADEVSRNAMFGMMAIMFTMADTENAPEPVGEWVANAGSLSISDVEQIRELLDAGTSYLDIEAQDETQEIVIEPTVSELTVSEIDAYRELCGEETFKIGGIPYRSYATVSMGNGREGVATVCVYTTDAAANELDTKTATIEYKGSLHVKIHNVFWEEPVVEDCRVALVEFEISANDPADSVVEEKDFVVK